MQNFGVTNKENYGVLWYFLEWSIHVTCMTLTVSHNTLEKWLILNSKPLNILSCQAYRFYYEWI